MQGHYFSLGPGLIVITALLVVSLVPAAWMRMRERERHQMHMEELMHLNASGLKRQKQVGVRHCITALQSTLLSSMA